MADTNPWQTQWTETINYLNAQFPIDLLGTHIQAIPGVDQSALTEETSLGNLGVGSDNKRHALRALLLCQRVYYSPLWAKFAFNGAPKVDEWSLPADWKTKSLGFWAHKGELEILAGVAMFAPVPGLTADALSTAAMAGPPSGSKEQLTGNLFLSRPLDEIPGPGETCYRGVCGWLLKAGFVSMRWIMSDSAPNGQLSCDRLFGTGEEVWGANRPYYPTNQPPKIETGFFVHMWKNEAGVGGWNGHWVVSNGDGTICGVNNGEVKKKGETVLKIYTNHGTLASQWEAYAGILKMPDPNKPKKMLPMYPDRQELQQYSHAHMVKFNPLSIPRL